MRVRSKSLKSLLAVLAGVVFLVFTIMTLLPVPDAVPGKTVRVRGEVVLVKSIENADIVIQLKGDERVFDINRGLERGLAIEELERTLPAAIVYLHCIERSWSPLDPLHRLAPVAQVETSGGIVFSALD